MVAAVNACALLCLVLFGQPQADDLGSLLVRFEGMPDAQAPVVAALFDNADSFNKRTGALRSVQLSVGQEKAVWEIKNLPLGEYGLLAFQDLNQNGELDLDRRGRPLEPYTTSGNVRKRAPRFGSTAFTFTEPATEIKLADWRFRAGRQPQKNTN